MGREILGLLMMEASWARMLRRTNPLDLLSLLAAWTSYGYILGKINREELRSMAWTISGVGNSDTLYIKKSSVVFKSTDHQISATPRQ
jgi:hypothetical protein